LGGGKRASQGVQQAGRKLVGRGIMGVRDGYMMGPGEKKRGGGKKN